MLTFRVFRRNDPYGAWAPTMRDADVQDLTARGRRRTAPRGPGAHIKHLRTGDYALYVFDPRAARRTLRASFPTFAAAADFAEAKYSAVIAAEDVVRSK